MVEHVVNKLANRHIHSNQLHHYSRLSSWTDYIQINSTTTAG